MNGLDRFGSALSKPVSKISLRILNEDRPGTSEWLKGVLVGVDKRAKEPPKSIRRDDRFLLTFVRAFSEVDSSASSLKVIANLARRSPPRSIGVESDAQLLFLIEAYLNEVYILSERCAALLTFVERAYRKDPRTRAVSQVVASIRATLAATLKPIVRTRGVHVHQARYSDFDVHRLGTLRLLAPSDPLFAAIHKAALRTGRKTTVGWMTQNNAEIRRLLDHYFDRLYPMVFDDKASPRHPSPKKAG